MDKEEEKEKRGDHGLVDVITSYYALKVWGTGWEANTVNSNWAGKGTCTSDYNSDVRSREITMMNVTVGFYL